MGIACDVWPLVNNLDVMARLYQFACISSTSKPRADN
jgi:hypothetical protein